MADCATRVYLSAACNKITRTIQLFISDSEGRLVGKNPLAIEWGTGDLKTLLDGHYPLPMEEVANAAGLPRWPEMEDDLEVTLDRAIRHLRRCLRTEIRVEGPRYRVYLRTDKQVAYNKTQYAELEDAVMAFDALVRREDLQGLVIGASLTGSGKGLAYHKFDAPEGSPDNWSGRALSLLNANRKPDKLT